VQVGGGNPRRQHYEGSVRHPSCPPPSLARAEDGGAWGDAILAFLVLEAVIVVDIVNFLEKFRALRRRHRDVVLVFGPDERRNDDITREGKDMAGGGRGCLSSSPSLTTWGART
jgi:hypothetical protein